MKPRGIAALVIVVLAVTTFLVIFLMARANVGVPSPSAFGKTRTGNPMNLMWLALFVDLVLCFAIVQWTPLEKYGALWAAVGVGIVGLIMVVGVVATRGMAEYVHIPLSWGGLGLVACGFGGSCAAFMKRG